LQVFYTGTHDNDTLFGWLNGQRRDAGDDAQIRERCADIIAGLYASDAMWVIVPLQDVWYLGSAARMNTPAVVGGNWVWEARKEDFTPESAAFLRELARSTDR
jgi:4-alpha-glucanotransferase